MALMKCIVFFLAFVLIVRFLFDANTDFYKVSIEVNLQIYIKRQNVIYLKQKHIKSVVMVAISNHEGFEGEKAG